MAKTSFARAGAGNPPPQAATAGGSEPPVVKRLAPPPSKPSAASTPTTHTVLTPKPEPTKVVEAEVVTTHTVSTSGNDELSTNVEVGTLITAPVGSIIGQLDANDFAIPPLKLLQNMSPLVIESRGEYLPGDWVMGETILWREDSAPVELTVLKIQKKFMQQTKYGEDRGKIYDTAEAARADGLVPFGGDGVGYVAFGLAIILIKGGEGAAEAGFTEEFGDSLYAMSLWQLTGMAYKTVIQKLATQSRNGRLQGGLHTGSFHLSARLEKGRVAPYWTPVFKDGPENSPDFIKFAEFCGGGNA